MRHSYDTQRTATDTTRLGGTSAFPFSSLNLGLHTGDVDEQVIANRELFCTAVGTAAKDAVTAEQVHGDKIAVVTARDIGKGAAVLGKPFKA